ncbi:MAG: tRNA-dihydrouridine synthase family protein [Elusimicrobiota bacterium]
MAEFAIIQSGCPARKIVKNNSGVMLMNSPELIARIITEIKENVDLPVSIKIRLGIKDNDNLIFSFLEKIKNAPVDLITVHIRYAENFHKGEPDLEIAKKIRDYIKVKYIVNGGITTLEKAGEVLEKTNCDGLMIGRPSLIYY